MGLSQRDVANDILVSLSSSGQVSPSYWLDKRGVQYLVAVQTPQYAVGSMDALNATPLSTKEGTPQLLSNVAQVSRSAGPVNITHYNVTRTYDVQANVEGTDLGSVANDLSRVVDEIRPDLPRGTKVTVTGQVESMETSFRGLGLGLLFAVVLVYPLMVVNFQSWLDPFVSMKTGARRSRFAARIGATTRPSTSRCGKRRRGKSSSDGLGGKHSASSRTEGVYENRRALLGRRNLPFPCVNFLDKPLRVKSREPPERSIP